MTALMKAVRYSHQSRVKELVAGGADVDELDPNGDAPLVMAAYLGHAGIVRRRSMRLTCARRRPRTCGQRRSTRRHMPGGRGGPPAHQGRYRHQQTRAGERIYGAYPARRDWENRRSTPRG